MSAPPIIYEDNHLLIVQKPPGRLTQPDGSARPDLLTWAGAYLARNKPGRAFVGLVHRLDRAVGGVMAMAKTSKAAARLSREFRERRIGKLYLALVTGEPPADRGRLVQLLVRDGDMTRPARSGETGSEAVLTWRLARRAGPLSLLEVSLETGFKHQIRAQLSSQGLPVAGDVRYQSPLAGPGPAIGLWARALTLVHPTRRESLTFTAEPAGLWPWSLIG
ncbi:MAG: RluA family pseudouridine synthase [Deltaproteobacteria bacterium]|nr:RluA family pseudouridine synthase [Deltaproteobacteria bacterium]